MFSSFIFIFLLSLSFYLYRQGIILNSSPSMSVMNWWTCQRGMHCMLGLARWKKGLCIRCSPKYSHRTYFMGTLFRLSSNLQLQLIPHLISLNYLQKPYLLIGLDEIMSKLKTSLLLKDWLVMLNHLNLSWNKVLQQLMHWTCCICLYQWRQLNLWAPSINKTDIDYGIWIIEHFLS